MMRTLHQPDLAPQRRASDPAPVSVGDTCLDVAVNWLTYHPRLTCALICGLCVSAGWLDAVLP